MEFKALLELMVEKKASDLFITSGRAPTIKVDGKLEEVSGGQLNAKQAMQIVKGVMSQKQKDEFDNTHECNFAISVPNLARFRVSAFIQRAEAGRVDRKSVV